MRNCYMASSGLSSLVISLLPWVRGAGELREVDVHVQDAVDGHLLSSRVLVGHILVHEMVLGVQEGLISSGDLGKAASGG